MVYKTFSLEKQSWVSLNPKNGGLISVENWVFVTMV